MAALESGPKPAADHYVVDAAFDPKRGSVSDASTIAYRDSFDDVDDYSPSVLNAAERRPATLLGSLFRAIGLSAKRRRVEDAGDYFASDSAGLLKSRRRSRLSPPREVRRCRRSYVGGCLRRTLLALPVVLLALLGLIHIAEFLLGQNNLLWELDDYDDWLPDWGKPGHEGDGLATYPTDATRDVIPISCASHNDYWRRVPLFDAIHWGCTGVEADVWLFDEELYVGHNTASLTKNRTLRNLYINPLVELLDKMNPNSTFADAKPSGVFDEDPDQHLVLLIDFKTNGKDTYPFVYKQLSALREKNYLTYYDGEKIHQRAITVVGTGNTPFNMIIANETYRDIFFDAPLDRMWDDTHPSSSSRSSSPTDANTGNPSSSQGTIGTEHTSPNEFNPSTSYYASVSFTRAVGFLWRGRLSEKQMALIRGQIRGAHKNGLKARYWDTPSWPISVRNHVWHVLMQEGADMLNVDDVRSAAVENWKVRNRGFW